MSRPDSSTDPVVPVRLEALRQAMRRHGVDACLVPSSDPHLSEYLPPRWKGREWLSGFTGSVGTFIATADEAGVWTDGRYWTQAEDELAGSGIALMKIPSGAGTQYIDWLAATLRPGQVVAVDGAVLGLAIARQLRQALDARGIALRTDLDVLDDMWADRPGLPEAPVFEHLPPFATTPRAAKLAALREAMARHGAQRHLISTLDDIAWLFNLRVTDGTRQAVPHHVTVIEAINPTTFAKSRKTEEEAVHVRATMEQDGAALCEFFAWLEEALARRHEAPLDEVDIDRHITAARARRPGFVSPSFGTIAGFQANGAIMHYRAMPGTCATIEGDGLLLIDSGGQYLGGTTDITRVVPVGAITVEHRRDFTLVLKGMMALSATRFPSGTRAPLLDAIARAPIWAAGIDFGHGTGHGVGYCLNVHEGPQSISPSTPPDPHTAMEPGMITSIEPGIYRPGKWGIRIENLVLNAAAGEGEFGPFLRFETLTLCPIDTRCVDRLLLREDEIAWLNDYHATVLARLRPHVQGAALAWLEERTQPL